jgi:mono/diheme cytochrome c family protein
MGWRSSVNLLWFSGWSGLSWDSQVGDVPIPKSYQAAQEEYVVTFSRAIGVWALGLGLVTAGCQRPEDPKVGAELADRSGTYAHPKLIGSDHHEDLALGQAVYVERCAQCHGDTGDGNGPAGKFMYPRPRDYRKGLFKFTSTPYGARPLRSDLIRTVKLGIRGTSMPDFKLLPQHEIEAVVDYVLTLTRRGEYEDELVSLAEAEEALPEDLVKEEAFPNVMRRWTVAENQQVNPITPQPKFTEEHVALGKKAFLTLGCSKCHGEDGRGQMKDNIGKDAWGQTTRAADLTSGMLHGGQQPIDIYRRIYSGINGTPMPGFAASLQSQPDTIWNLVAYVKFISNRRREGEIPLPGPIKPYVEAAPPAAAVTATE